MDHVICNKKGGETLPHIPWSMVHGPFLRGFTLIELLVVLSAVSVLLFLRTFGGGSERVAVPIPDGASGPSDNEMMDSYLRR